MAFKVLSIFGSKNETRILNLIQKHLSLVKKANREFQQIASFAFSKKFNEVIQGAQAVDSIEKEADDIKREIENELYRGAFLPVTRSNLYTLIEKQDQVCNQLQNASNMFIYLKKRKPSRQVEQILKSLVIEASRSIQSLDKIVSALFFKKNDISKDIEEMKAIEKKADMVQRKLFDALLLNGKKIDPLSANFFGNLGHALSEICDEVKHACDFVALIFVLKQA